MAINKRIKDLPMCTFCGKPKDKVGVLVAGPSAYICDACIDVCKAIADKVLHEQNTGKSGQL